MQTVASKGAMRAVLDQAASGSSDWRRMELEIMVRARAERAAWLRGIIRGAAGGLARHLRDHVLEPARRARRRREDLKVLLALDDHTLDDIGLRRIDLQAARLGLVPVERAVARQAAAQLDRVGTVVTFPAAGPAPARDRDLPTAA